MAEDPADLLISGGFKRVENSKLKNKGPREGYQQG